VKLVKPDVGVGFAADHAEVLLRSEIVVLLGVGTSRRLEQQPHDKRLLALEHWVKNRDHVIRPSEIQTQKEKNNTKCSVKARQLEE